MRRYFFIAAIAVYLLIAFTMPALADQTLDLYIDGKLVPVEPNIYYNIDGEKQGTYYMDVEPELKDGRAYVPIRMISKFLGADIDWQSPDILLISGGNDLKLTINKNTAIKNGSALSLDAPPYIKEGRAMVPLRFIAEAFGSKVDYASGRIDIMTGHLRLNDIEIGSLRSRTRMTMGSFIYETKTNSCIKGMYRLFTGNFGDEIPAPEYFDETLNIDVANYYYMMQEYSFFDINGVMIQQYKTYQLFKNSYILDLNGVSGIDYGDYLILDVNTGKWYRFTQKALDDIDDLSSTGDWLLVSNTVV